jgi:hypothetical protein
MKLFAKTQGSTLVGFGWLLLLVARLSERLRARLREDGVRLRKLLVLDEDD